MPEPHDALSALRTPIDPVMPDPGFAAVLRRQLARALSQRQPQRQPQEPVMSINPAIRHHHGLRHGDVSYVTLGLPDLDRGRAFYGAVLGWRFSPGRSEQGAQVEDVVPMTGLWAGGLVAGPAHGAVLAFRVDDIATAVAAVRAHGGTVTPPHEEPYGLAAEGHDDQGIPFYLHELPAEPAASAYSGGDFHNGDVEGDLSYLTMIVPDLDAARAFYGGVLGWTFNVGRAGGAQVTGVAPQIGLTTRFEAGHATSAVILCYRVDDITAATGRVLDADGQAGPVAQQPYALEALCADDQGTLFYLHQF